MNERHEWTPVPPPKPGQKLVLIFLAILFLAIAVFVKNLAGFGKGSWDDPSEQFGHFRPVLSVAIIVAAIVACLIWELRQGLADRVARYLSTEQENFRPKAAFWVAVFLVVAYTLCRELVAILLAALWAKIRHAAKR